MAGCAGPHEASAPRTHAVATAIPAPTAPEFTPLFPEDGLPAGWFVRSWQDVAQPAAPDAAWVVERGVLRGSQPRGTWLISEQEFDNFILRFEFRLGEGGRGGVGLRFPSEGDPAVHGLEVVLVDPRYYSTNTPAAATEHTGGLAAAIPPNADRYVPGGWNRVEITCRGSFLKVRINDGVILDLDLDAQTQPVAQGLPLAARPRVGRLGFREISRGRGHLEIRQAEIQRLH